MKTIGEVLDMLSKALHAGCVFEVSYDNEIFSIDMNTGGKSACRLRLEPDGIKAYRRYDRVDTVKDFNDVVDLVYDCCHGRNYFNSGWLQVFKNYNMKDPRGYL